MAIDPKTLYIGSHVMVDGLRTRVTDIESNYDWSGDTLLRVCAVIDGEKRTCGAFSQKDGVEPITITEELLEELGFEKVALHTRPKPIIQYVDAESIKAQAEDLDVRVVPRITIQYVNVPDPFWSVSAYGKNMEDNKVAVRYLHELESFIYLTTKTELIKD